MRFPVKVGRGVGLLAVTLSLLGAASKQAFGQVAATHPGLPAPSATTAQSNPIPLAFAQSSFPNATFGVFFNSSVQIIGGSGLLTMTINGDLPPGLVVEIGSNTVAVGGVPTQAGHYSFQISVRDTNGAALQGDFTIQVLAQSLQTMAQIISPKVVDNETFNFHDAENVFFPAVISDAENFKFTDTESDLDAVIVVDRETITLTDTEGEKESAFLVDRENIMLTDTVAEAESAFVVDSEKITLTDTDSFKILNLPKLTWATPAAIAYGTALSGTQLDATASVGGSFAYTPPVGTIPPAGLNTLTVVFTPNDTADYAPATASVQLTVTAPAALTNPTPGTVLPGSSVSFSWSAGSGVTNYELYLGATGVGSHDIYSSGAITATSVSNVAVPAYGVTVYARLFSKIGGVWQSADYTYTEAGSPLPAAISTPTPGSILPSASQSFAWTQGGGVTAYQLYVGTTGVGSHNLYYSGAITTLSANVTGLPTNGNTVYVRLYSEINGSWSSYTDYTYQGGAIVTPAINSPAPGATLTGTSQTFTWTAGSNATQYYLYAGTTGPGSYDLYNDPSTTGSATVANIPTLGLPVYVRLSYKINGAWQYTDYTFTEAITPHPATMTTPAPSSKLPSTSVTFTWWAGLEVTAYQLYVGTTGVASHNLYYSNTITTTSATVTNLPNAAQTVYVRLYSKINGSWSNYIDYTYTASGTPVPAAMSTPTPGSTLPGASQTFTWSQGSGVTAYQLYVGTTGVASHNLLYTGTTTALSANVINIPIDALTVYVRLYSEIGGSWSSYTDYTYTEAGTPTPAAMLTPTPGSTLPAASQSFTWTQGIGATAYQLYVGTTGVASHNLLYTGTITATSASVTNLPLNGEPVYVRLYSKIDGVWQFIDYTYTAQ